MAICEMFARGGGAARRGTWQSRIYRGICIFEAWQRRGKGVAGERRTSKAHSSKLHAAMRVTLTSVTFVAFFGSGGSRGYDFFL